MSYIRVCDDFGGDSIELPTEDDDSLPVTTLQAQFPNAIGLKYLPDEGSDVFRGIRCVEGRLLPPKGGWDNINFHCTYPPDYKRKSGDSHEAAPKAKKSCGPREVKCSDLIVLGLSFSTTDESLKKYFEDNFGQLLMALVKTDLQSKRSRGFGFIRFNKYEDQVKALSARKHEIDGRWVTIKPPYAKEGVESSLPSKVFISRLTPVVKKEDLTEYFSKYGEIADVFLPNTPFRGFAFVTFVSPESADRACEEEPHIVNNISVSVVHATDQQKKPSYSDRRRDYGSRYNDYESYGPPRERGYRGSSSRNWRGNYNSNNSRDYDYDRRGGGGGYGNGGGSNDISNILAQALKNNPNAINSLINNLGGKGNTGRDYGANCRDYDDDSYDYDNKYNPYDQDNKGYNGSGKMGGGNAAMRY